MSEVQAQLGAAARARGIPFEKLLTEMLGRVAKKAGGPKLVRQG